MAEQANPVSRPWRTRFNMANIAALVLVCTAVVVAYFYYPRKKPLPSIAEVLKDGGLYPIPIPLGWKMIEGDGQAIDFPEIPGAPFHAVEGLAGVGDFGRGGDSC